MKIIASCGMHRSGSTWLYNIIRLSLDHSNSNYDCGFYSEFDWRSSSKDVVLVKIHPFRKILFDKAEKIIITKRDVRDICASAVRRKLIPLDETKCLKYVSDCINKEYIPWIYHSNKYKKPILEISYRDIVYKKDETINKVISFLNIRTNHNLIKKSMLEIFPPEQKNGYDSVTLLHYGHITNGGIGTFKDVLPEQIHEKIKKMFYEWVEE